MIEHLGGVVDWHDGSCSFQSKEAVGVKRTIKSNAFSSHVHAYCARLLSSRLELYSMRSACQNSRSFDILQNQFDPKARR